jgi:pyruvate/2-oxoglutarate/acetoin dehydrogenase E1 component
MPTAMFRIPGAASGVDELCAGGVPSGWSRTLHAALEAAQKARQSVEVIDLRTLWPWDRETVFASVRKTKMLLVVHEAVQAAGFGAEIAATAAEELGVPVKRLGAPRIPVGYSKPLEDEARVTAERILRLLE